MVNWSDSHQKQSGSDKELLEAALSSEDEDHYDEVHFVLAEIGSSSSEEGEESDENDYDNSSCVGCYLCKIREESNTLSVMNCTR